MAKPGLREFFPELFGGLKNVLGIIGIEAEHLHLIGSGFSTSVFDTGHHQVVKIRNKDVSADEWPESLLPECKYVLQPVCLYDDYSGFLEIGVFPKLRVGNGLVNEAHQKALIYALAEEGYNFSDNKCANIGLSETGVPYVIDSDAVFLLKKEVSMERPALLNVIRWPESQWSVFPRKVLGTGDIDFSGVTGWQFNNTINCEIDREEVSEIVPSF